MARLIDPSNNIPQQQKKDKSCWKLLLRVLGGLNPAVVFNIAISDWGNQVVLFNNMVPATPANVEKVKEWIASLNTRIFRLFKITHEH